MNDLPVLIDILRLILSKIDDWTVVKRGLLMVNKNWNHFFKEREKVNKSVIKYSNSLKCFIIKTSGFYNLSNNIFYESYNRYHPIYIETNKIVNNGKLITTEKNDYFFTIYRVKVIDGNLFKYRKRLFYQYKILFNNEKLTKRKVCCNDILFIDK